MGPRLREDDVLAALAVWAGLAARAVRVMIAQRIRLYQCRCAPIAW
jgi:hypothetical protein